MPCSKCGGANDRAGQRYCRACHNLYMRGWRPKHSELSPQERFKANARAYANTYQSRGKLQAQPCQCCGSNQSVEKHHNDYSRPLDVEWLCRKCHKAEHTQNVARLTIIETKGAVAFP